MPQIIKLKHPLNLTYINRSENEEEFTQTCALKSNYKRIKLIRHNFSYQKRKFLQPYNTQKYFYTKNYVNQINSIHLLRISNLAIGANRVRNTTVAK